MREDRIGKIDFFAIKVYQLLFLQCFFDCCDIGRTPQTIFFNNAFVIDFLCFTIQNNFNKA